CSAYNGAFRRGMVALGAVKATRATSNISEFTGSAEITFNGTSRINELANRTVDTESLAFSGLVGTDITGDAGSGTSTGRTTRVATSRASVAHRETRGVCELTRGTNLA